MDYAVASDPGHNITLRYSAWRFCKDVADNLRQQIDPAAGHRFSGYRVNPDPGAVFELSFFDRSGEEIAFIFLEVHILPDYLKWPNIPEHGGLEIPVMDALDAVLMAQFILKEVTGSAYLLQSDKHAYPFEFAGSDDED